MLNSKSSSSFSSLSSFSSSIVLDLVGFSRYLVMSLSIAFETSITIFSFCSVLTFSKFKILSVFSNPNVSNVSIVIYLLSLFVCGKSLKNSCVNDD